MSKRKCVFWEVLTGGFWWSVSSSYVRIELVGGCLRWSFWAFFGRFSKTFVWRLLSRFLWEIHSSFSRFSRSSRVHNRGSTVKFCQRQHKFEMCFETVSREWKGKWLYLGPKIRCLFDFSNWGNIRGSGMFPGATAPLFDPSGAYTTTIWHLWLLSWFRWARPVMLDIGSFRPEIMSLVAVVVYWIRWQLLKC